MPHRSTQVLRHLSTGCFREPVFAEEKETTEVIREHLARHLGALEHYGLEGYDKGIALKYRQDKMVWTDQKQTRRHI